VHVKIDVRKPLGRFVTVSRAGKREFYQVKYEEVSKFSGVCGMLGHTHLECGSGEHDVDNMQWGHYLKANWETWIGRGNIEVAVAVLMVAVAVLVVAEVEHLWMLRGLRRAMKEGDAL
jgi:hypothetical protein